MRITMSYDQVLFALKHHFKGLYGEHFLNKYEMEIETTNADGEELVPEAYTFKFYPKED